MPRTIRKYQAAVDPFVQHCGVNYVDEGRDIRLAFRSGHAENLLGRRMVDSVLLVQALGGGGQPNCVTSWWPRSSPTGAG